MMQASLSPLLCTLLIFSLYFSPSHAFSTGRKFRNGVEKREYLENLEKLEKEKYFEEPIDEEVENIANTLKLSNEERLNKIIARAGVASRRGAESLILDGRVTVNGKIITELGIKVKPNKDIIVVDGKKLSLPDAKNTFWVALNKPRSVITTMEDDKDRETIASLVPKARELRLVPVGRMERDATGILLLTNEIGWIHPLTHLSFENHKRYEIVVQGMPSEEDLEKLKEGVVLKDDTTKSPVKVRKVNVIDSDAKAGLCLLDVFIQETRPLQMQGMMEAIGCPLVSTKRTEFGTVGLSNMKRGQWRELTKPEVDKLKASCKKSETGDDSGDDGRERSGGKRRFKPKTRRPGSGYASRTTEASREVASNIGDAYNSGRVYREQSRERGAPGSGSRRPDSSRRGDGSGPISSPNSGREWTSSKAR